MVLHVSRIRLPVLIPFPPRALQIAALGIAAVWAAFQPPAAHGQASTPGYLTDRGSGVATSLFGTYIRKGEFQVYPFYEYYGDRETYAPEDFGYDGDKEYQARTTEHEFLLYLAYGFTEDFAIEFESALYVTKSIEKDPDDPSDRPKRFSESGLGDTEMSLRYRLWNEAPSRPELYSYLKIVFPLQRDKKLIGTQDWELGPGLGIIKGFDWGTLKLAASAEYSAEDKEWGSSVLLEYLKRFSPSWRGVLAVESSGDEVEGVVEVQWFWTPDRIVKLNVAVGLSESAPDIAPEIGVLFTF